MIGPQPLRLRILGALLLQPMTVPELARCLMRSQETIRRGLYGLRKEAIVEACGIRYGRPGVAMYAMQWTPSMVYRSKTLSIREKQS